MRTLTTQFGFRFCLAITLSALATAALAESINVDFNATYQPAGFSGTYTGTAVAPDAGTFWNGWLVPQTAIPTVDANATSPVLLNSAGATPSAGFGTNVEVKLNGGNWSAIDFAYNGPTNQAPALMGDALYGGSVGSPLTYTISGLVIGKAYDLYLYSQNGSNYSAATAHLVGGVEHDIDNKGTPSLSTSGFIAGRNYTTYLNVAADGFGTISGAIWATDANNSSFNGFQLMESVPEPASIVLFGLAAIGLVPVARRRKG